MHLASSSAIFVKKMYYVLNVLAMSNLFVIAMPFMLRYVGNWLLLHFLREFR